MTKLSDTMLRRRRQVLVQQLGRLQACILRGSLIERYLPCGKATCHCHHGGRGHGPKHYLAMSFPGGRRPELDYVPAVYAAQVAQYVQNLQQVRQWLEEICTLNRELLRRRVPFQLLTP